MLLTDLWLYFLIVFARFALGWVRRWPVRF
jgi:hypothetical protein